jgi:hypothetical protein
MRTFLLLKMGALGRDASRLRIVSFAGNSRKL